MEIGLEIIHVGAENTLFTLSSGLEHPPVVSQRANSMAITAERRDLYQCRGRGGLPERVSELMKG